MRHQFSLAKLSPVTQVSQPVVDISTGGRVVILVCSRSSPPLLNLLLTLSTPFL